MRTVLHVSLENYYGAYPLFSFGMFGILFVFHILLKRLFNKFNPIYPKHFQLLSFALFLQCFFSLCFVYLFYMLSISSKCLMSYLLWSIVQLVKVLLPSFLYPRSLHRGQQCNVIIINTLDSRHYTLLISFLTTYLLLAFL